MSFDFVQIEEFEEISSCKYGDFAVNGEFCMPWYEGETMLVPANFRRREYNVQIAGCAPGLGIWNRNAPSTS